MLKAPSNDYEHLRAGMEYKLAVQAIRKLVRMGNQTDYALVTEISKIIKSMEEDLRKRRGDNEPTA